MKWDSEKLRGKPCTAPTHTILGFSPLLESYFHEYQIQQIQCKKRPILEYSKMYYHLKNILLLSKILSIFPHY